VIGGRPGYAAAVADDQKNQPGPEKDEAGDAAVFDRAARDVEETERQQEEQALRATGGLRTLADPATDHEVDLGAHVLTEREEQAALDARLKQHEREQHRLEEGLEEVERQLHHDAP
jgi:hypothetical protein